MSERLLRTPAPAARWWRGLGVRGVVWRRALRFGVLSVPIWLEPLFIGCWSLIFLLWGPGRRGVMQNLRAIKPGSGALVNFFRTYRVFWNYSWTLADNVRFSEHRTVPDWEFEGLNHFEQMISDPSGAIMLTAHMGSYDLGANLFASTSGRTVVMVRAPEQEAETHQYEESRWNSQSSESLRVGFNTATSDLAFDLLQSVQRGEIVAIQGDRVTGGVAALETALFGMRTRLPAGPFALAMATGAAIYPMFVVRVGRRRYRLVACPPIRVTRTSRNRDEDLGTGLEAWRAALEASISRGWMQWFTFEPFFTGSSS